MTYGRYPYGGVAYAGSDVADIPADTKTTLAVEVSFSTDALSEPVWVDITGDVRSWDTTRGRNRELERFQPGRATVVLSNGNRQYDSVNAAGPWFGFIRPMRRIRIRETFSGVTYPVFDGFIDRWQLDYPATGKDATATITATDAFKIFARTDLPRSVYTAEVEADEPVLWWRLDETRADPSTSALNDGSLGSAADGTYVGPVKERGVQGLVFHDAGSAVEVVQPFGTIPESGITIDGSVFDLSDYGSWAIEFWTVGTGDLVGVDRWVHGENPAGNLRLAVHSDGAGQKWQFRIVNAADTTEYGVTGDAAGYVSGTRYHVVVKFGPNKDMAIYVNGTKYTATATAATAPPLVGSIHADMDIGFLYTFGDGQTPDAVGDEFAIYTSAEGVDPLSDARISAHYAAGNTPWQGDGPDDRIGRVLDLSEWPTGLRELDAGGVTLQSAELATDALEHLQKVGETEFGLLFISRDGKIRFISRAAQFARTSGQAQWIDLPGTSGNYASTPDSAAVSITGDLTIIAELAPDDWTPAGTRSVVLSKYLSTGNQRSFMLTLNNAGTLSLWHSTAGAAGIEKVSTVATGLTDGAKKWVAATLDVNNGAAGFDVKFYTSSDGVSWTQLGTTVTTAGITSVFDSTAALEIGSRTNGTEDLLAGNVSYAEIRSGLAALLGTALVGGTVVARFDANTVATTGVRTPNSWVANGTGETWTVNGSAWDWGSTGVIFGDAAGEVGYRSITPDDGDEVIRNRATISRLNGVAKSDEDAASVDEFARFDYTLDGLLHSSDTHSQSYADFIVAEYKDIRRRITSLTLGPPNPTTAAALYPQMLGRELGAAIVVRSRPPGGGATFEQTCVIEGVQQSGQAGGNRMTTLILSPEMAGSF